MSAQLTEQELEIIWAAAAALPPPQRAAFQQQVVAELKNLPCGMMGPGSLHRIIAACQRTLLRAGAVAVGPSPKHGGKPGRDQGQAGPRGLRCSGDYYSNLNLAIIPKLKNWRGHAVPRGL